MHSDRPLHIVSVDIYVVRIIPSGLIISGVSVSEKCIQVLDRRSLHDAGPWRHAVELGFLLGAHALVSLRLWSHRVEFTFRTAESRRTTLASNPRSTPGRPVIAQAPRSGHEVPKQSPRGPKRGSTRQ